jgi:hypothetical protein
MIATFILLVYVLVVALADAWVESRPGVDRLTG